MKNEMKHQPGCCADKSCDDQTCMRLPLGKRCSDCVHITRCTTIFGQSADDPACQFYPSRYLAKGAT